MTLPNKAKEYADATHHMPPCNARPRVRPATTPAVANPVMSILRLRGGRRDILKYPCRGGRTANARHGDTGLGATLPLPIRWRPSRSRLRKGKAMTIKAVPRRGPGRTMRFGVPARMPAANAASTRSSPGHNIACKAVLHMGLPRKMDNRV